MKPVFAIASNITSFLGMDTPAHWRAVAAGQSGIRRYEDGALSNVPFFGSRLDPGQWQAIQQQVASSRLLSPFEQLALYAAKRAIQECGQVLLPADTLVILATTKGNIEWIGQVPDDRLLLPRSASLIADGLGMNSKTTVVSNACISGVMALLYGMRQLQSGRYKHAIVIGCDRFTRFVLSGFQSFHAVAPAPCRPFDAGRKGINLGEAAAAIILSVHKDEDTVAELMGGASTNDANHISGPSRTGEELAMAITRSFASAGIAARDIDMISAHGTATMYNDEMEALAFGLAGLLQTPVHSMKGYTGHTLGAAGILESAMILESMRHQCLIPTTSYSAIGVSEPLNITTQMEPAGINYVLKTASGFGGGNAALILKRVAQ